MNCHYCGTEVSGREVFCRHCGTRLQGAVLTEPAEVPAVETAPVLEEMPAIAQETVPAAPEIVAAAPAKPEYPEKTFGWQPYGGAPAPEEPLFDFEKTAAAAPKLQLPTRRSLVKMIFLSIVTLGIYPMVIWSRLVGEVNMVASRYDGERSMSFFGMLMLSPITLGIHSLVWMNKLCRRIGAELQRRSIDYSFGAKDFWIWCFLMSFLYGVCMGVIGALYAIGFDLYFVFWILLAVGLITLVGPFIFLHKLIKSMNKLNADYNING